MAAQPPNPARREQREWRVVHFIGLFKVVKALILYALSATALQLVHHDVEHVVELLAREFHLNPAGHILARLEEHAGHVTPHGLRLFALAAFAYAALYTTEGIGLFLDKRWAEWLTV